MMVELREETGVAVVEPYGRLDLRTAGTLKQRLRTLIEGGRHQLVVDLRQVDFIDSAGLAALVSGLKQARTHNGDVRLAAPQDPVRIILEITRLHRTFDIYERAEEAVASFQGMAVPSEIAQDAVRA